MSVTLSRLQLVATSSFSLAGRCASWMLTDNRPPIRRFQIAVDHTRTPQHAIWLPTRLLANVSLLCIAVIATGATFAAIGLMFDVARDRAELYQVARRYAGARIDQWETAHGFTCLIWQENDAQGGTVMRHGGPSCAATLTPPAGSPAEGGAP